MKQYIVLFFCMTYCTTALGHGWLIALLKCCISAQHPQRHGIQIDAKLYQNGQSTPISSDSRFYYQDASKDYVPTYDPIQPTHAHAENRITLGVPTIAANTNSAAIKFTTRIGLGSLARIEERNVTVNIGSDQKEIIESSSLYAIISASKATRILQ
jgi:hypothetical protein